MVLEVRVTTGADIRNRRTNVLSDQSQVGGKWGAIQRRFRDRVWDEVNTVNAKRGDQRKCPRVGVVFFIELGVDVGGRGDE